MSIWARAPMGRAQTGPGPNGPGPKRNLSMVSFTGRITQENKIDTAIYIYIYPIRCATSRHRAFNEVLVCFWLLTPSKTEGICFFVLLKFYVFSLVLPYSTWKSHRTMSSQTGGNARIFFLSPVFALFVSYLKQQNSRPISVICG